MYSYVHAYHIMIECFYQWYILDKIGIKKT